MKRWLLILAVCAGAAIAAIAAETTTRPEVSPSAPASRPSERPLRAARSRSFAQRSVSASPNLPTIYEEVASRNIFVRGNQRPGRPDSEGNGSFNNVPTPNQLLLTGVSLTNNGKVAFLENQDANQVTLVRIGDKVSTGKAVNMTLDSLDYQDAGGKVIRVNVGFNLAGGDVWGVSGSSSTQASTQPSRTGPRGPGESMEDYLRRRRAAEVGR
ncbi:MAG: hypothetical protein ABSB74_16770 [Tepidisphaeraceae bacterium]